MNILFTRFPLESSPHGGAENQTMWLMQGLKEKGHEVRFLGSCPALLQRARESGIKNQESRIGPPPVTKWSAVSFFWRKRRMRQMLIETIEKLQASSFKLQAIFMLSLSEKLLLTNFASAQGIKVFWLEHDRIGPWLRRNPWLPSLRRAARNATIVCVSELSRKLYEELGFDPEKITVIPNGVPIPPTRSPLTAHRSPLRLGCIARLSPEKGVDILLQAIADLPEVSLTIVGKGPSEGYIRRLIDEDSKRMGTDVPRIQLLPFVDDLDAFYESVDALILPSVDHDPFGLVAAEAMMCGIPIIVTDKTGVAGYLKSGEDALVVKAGDAESLTVALREVLSPELRARLSENGKKTAEREFGLEKMVSRYEELMKA